MNCIINFLLITLKNLDKTFLVKNQTKIFKINRPQRLRYMCIWVLYTVTSIHSVYLSFANLGTNIWAVLVDGSLAVLQDSHWNSEANLSTN